MTILACASSISMPLADESVDCIVTSPPYWRLRDYQVGKWFGGDPECAHLVGRFAYTISEKQASNFGSSSQAEHVCSHCGATREGNHQLGQEDLHDCLGWATGQDCGECFVCHTRQWAREGWRVLKLRGTMWLNLGDTYGGSGGAGGDYNHGGLRAGQPKFRGTQGVKTLKVKDLVGIPWRCALALQADGWYLRSSIIWEKPNPMPESVRDRPTRAHEHIFLLTKSPQYFYNADAIKTPAKESSVKRINSPTEAIYGGRNKHAGFGTRISSGNEDNRSYIQNGVNARNVWSIGTRGFKGAHFAVFPEALAEKMVLAGCPRGGAVLDPFCGSGTVGVICKHHGMEFIGLDISTVYLQDIVGPRIADAEEIYDA